LNALEIYAASKPETVFVLKNNGHRGIKIVDAKDPKLTKVKVALFYSIKWMFNIG